MSKTKGVIIIELPEVPEDCYCCDQVNEAGYCYHVGKYVDHFIKIGERYPTCPIVPMQKACETDKVVEQLKEHAIEFEAFGICSDYVELTHAIEIVKGSAE